MQFSLNKKYPFCSDFVRSVSQADQKLALSLLLELSVQQGSLSQMLNSVLLLLQLEYKNQSTPDNRY